jgi:predicted transcriptional regulator
MPTNGAIVQRRGPLTTLMPAPKKKVGRKPAGESKSAEHQLRVTEWKLTPERLRKPSTAVELAAELGISREMVKYYVQKSAENIGQFVEDIEQRAITGDYADIVDKISELAKKGHPEMAKLFMRQIVEPRRLEPQNGSHMNNDPVLNATLKVLLRGDSEQGTAAASASLSIGMKPSEQQ